MAEKQSSSFYSTASSNIMDIDQLDNKKDVSKVFTYLRNKLNAKEKELLELQRAESCLLAPDSKQIDTLVDLISSLHLSTQDGSFLFPSTSTSDSSLSTSVYSTGVETIKTLPTTTWLSQSNLEKKEENQYRLPMVTHLFSLPINAYIASSSNRPPIPSIESNPVKKEEIEYRLPIVTQLLSLPANAFVASSSNRPTLETSSDTITEPSNRLPMVNQLLSMPINAFRSPSPSNNQSIPVKTEEKQETVNNNTKDSSTPIKSILTSERIYSKEHWLRKSSSNENEEPSLDIDAYIAQSTEKMKRLHLQYLEALEKLKSPSDPIDSSQMIKTMYPQMFDRINEDMSPKDLTRLLPSKK